MKDKHIDIFTDDDAEGRYMVMITRQSAAWTTFVFHNVKQRRVDQIAELVPLVAILKEGEISATGILPACNVAWSRPAAWGMMTVRQSENDS